jgi:pimeloyl-ACP methyl ester carboxylesterase
MADLVLSLDTVVALQQATRLYRAPRLVAPGAVEEAHLAAARRLDVGPMPAAGRGASTLGGLVDGVAFRALRRAFSSIHRREAESAGYEELEGGWLAVTSSALLEGERYFPAPVSPDVRVARSRPLPGGGVLEDLELHGAYSDRPAARQLLERCPENAVAYARCYRHSDARPALIWLHGWGMGFPGVEALVCRARRLYALGLDVYLYVLPYHARRRPRGVRFAGEVFPTTDMTRSNEGVLQAVWECRSLMAWHRARTLAPCGVVGLSLGGYLAAVLASVAPETAFCACLMPVADLPTLMWSNGEGTLERRRAEEAGISFDLFCRSMAVHAPLAHQLLLPRERVLLVGARADRIIPPVHTEVLHQHWGSPRVCWIPGGHLMQLGRRAYLEELEALLRAAVL